MVPGKAYTPEDILLIAWHRKWLIVLPLVLVSVGTILFVQWLPNRYRSETLILVVPQRVPESYVRSTVTTRIEDRLHSIGQQILSRTRLERVIQDFNLYVDERKKLTMEDVVEQMRGDIIVATVKGDAFRVSYTSQNDRTAQKVTERLASMFIEENLRDREVLAEGTNQFLESQLEDARQRLIEHEKKLEAYRLRYSNELPSQLQSNLQVIQNARLQLQGLMDSISRDRDRRLLLERMIADVQVADVAPNPPAPGQPAAPMPTGEGGRAVDQLAAARNTLRALETRLKPEHPDIVNLKRAIPELEKKAEAEVRDKPVNGPIAPRPDPAQAARRNRVREVQAEIENLDRQIADKEAQRRQFGEAISGYQRRVEAIPTRESELTELMRDYDTLQKMYATLLGKKEESQIAANLERRQIGEQFKVLDPARLPERPYSPKRAQLDLLGVLCGLAMGLGFAALLEYLDSSIKTEDDVVRGLSLPVLATIPLMMTAAERARGKRRKLMLSCATVVMLLSATAAVAAWKLDALKWIR